MRKVDRIILLLVVSALLLLVTGCSNKEKNTGQQQTPEQHQDEQDKKALSAIHDAAEKGQLPNLQWQAGETKFRQITGQLGDADNMERQGDAAYATYEDTRLTLGLTENKKVYELRSSAPELTTITLEEAVDVLGAPDERDESEKKAAFIYELNDEFQLTLRFSALEEKSVPVEQIAVIHKPSAEIQATVHNMEIDEKLGQLILMGVQGPKLDATAKAYVQEKHIGGIILFKRNFVSVPQSLTLINDLKQANAKAEVPLFISADEEGGRVTRLPKEIVKTPSNRTIGNVGEGKYAFEIGELLGRKMKAFGMNMDFAPVMDVDSNPDNPVIGDRSFSPDARLVGKAGVQQANGMTSQHVIPVVKHFPGHGDTSVDSHIDLPIIAHSKERLQKVELLPFKEAIQAGVKAVMVGHLIVQAYDAETPASFSKPVIQGLLRGDMKYEGVVITDDLIMGAVGKNYPIGDAAIQSIQAGGDILLVGHDYQPVGDILTALQEALHEGTITEQRINQSVERILLLKQQYEVDDVQRGNVDVEELNRLTKALVGKIQSQN